MKKILIVEDDSVLFEALKNIFGMDPKIKVLHSNNGLGGLRKALLEHPDLILLDIILPEMDGITMLRKLRQDKWGKNAEVVILTNLSEEKTMEASTCSGVSDYLIKSNWKIKDLVKKSREKLGLQ